MSFRDALETVFGAVVFLALVWALLTYTILFGPAA